jgi:hypothetical protein
MGTPQEEPQEGLALAPRPLGWASGGELLARFLLAFDLAGARAALGPVSAQRMTKARAGTPADGDAYGRQHASEVGQARETLRELLGRVDELRGATLVRPREYAELWRGIVEDWNHVVVEHGWSTLPTVCQACGRPVLVKGTGDGSPSLTCSEACRHVVRARDAKQRKKRRARTTG